MEPARTIFDFLAENPLLQFSGYTHTQSGLVRSLGNEVLALLDEGIVPSPNDGEAPRCDGRLITEARGRFWLWVLGAYELVRTMVQHERHFSAPLQGKLKDLKRSLHAIRIPFAKLELPGKPVKPIRGELITVRVLTTPADLWHHIEGKDISTRELISNFETVFSGICPEDVLTNRCEPAPAIAASA